MTRTKTRTYLSSTLLTCATARAQMGFHAAKFPLPYSHAEGEEGMRKNIECIRKHRESVGPDFPLMIDCYMSLTVPLLSP